MDEAWRDPACGVQVRTDSISHFKQFCLAGVLFTFCHYGLSVPAALNGARILSVIAGKSASFARDPSSSGSDV